jgi:hypothetical protein
VTRILAIPGRLGQIIDDGTLVHFEDGTSLPRDTFYAANPTAIVLVERAGVDSSAEMLQRSNALDAAGIRGQQARDASLKRVQEQVMRNLGLGGDAYMHQDAPTAPEGQ